MHWNQDVSKPAPQKGSNRPLVRLKKIDQVMPMPGGQSSGSQYPRQREEIGGPDTFRQAPSPKRPRRDVDMGSTTQFFYCTCVTLRVDEAGDDGRKPPGSVSQNWLRWPLAIGAGGGRTHLHHVPTT